MLGSCDDDGVVDMLLDVLAGSPVAGSEGVVGLVPSSCEDGGELKCLHGLAGGPVADSGGVAGAAGDDDDAPGKNISLSLPLFPLLLLLGVVSQSLSILLFGEWTPFSSLIIQFPFLEVRVENAALSSLIHLSYSSFFFSLLLSVHANSFLLFISRSFSLSSLLISKSKSIFAVLLK